MEGMLPMIGKTAGHYDKITAIWAVYYGVEQSVKI